MAFRVLKDYFDHFYFIVCFQDLCGVNLKLKDFYDSKLLYAKEYKEFSGRLR